MKALFVIVLLFCSSLFADLLRGKVVNALTGKPIPYAKVTTDINVKIANKHGYFKIYSANNYISVRARGYKRKKVYFNGGSIELLPFRTKALYVSMDAVKNRKKLRTILNIAARTKINTLVVDVKIAKGYLTFKGKNGLARAIGAYKFSAKVDPKKFVRFLKSHGVYLIARFPVFKDDLLARKRPNLAVKRGRRIFRDRDKLRWVNPFNSFVQNYNINLVKEIASYGFDEIQFDYIRFPAKNNLNFHHVNNQNERVKALQKFLRRAKYSLTPYNVFTSIDTFGASCWTNYDVGIGHNLKRLKKYVDYISPMLYPSGFTHGIPGLRNPVSNNYKVISRSLKSSMKRHKISPKQFKPWLQAFNDYAFDRRNYGQKQLNDQIRACDNLGTSGWLVWNASSNYSKYFPIRKYKKYRKHKKYRKIKKRRIAKRIASREDLDITLDEI